MAAGLSAVEIAGLKASDIRMAGGYVTVMVGAHKGSVRTHTLALPLGARVLAWLSERRLWNTAAPVFGNKRGGYTSRGIRAVLDRYRRPPIKARSSRQGAAVDPLEFLTWWEGREGRRPLSQRDLAEKLGFSESTIRRRLKALRAAGQVDDEARKRALAAWGGLPGRRPPNPLPDVALI